MIIFGAGLLAMVGMIFTGLFWMAGIVAYITFAILIKVNTARRNHPHTKFIFIAYGLGLFFPPVAIGAIIYSFFLPDQIIGWFTNDNGSDKYES
ncbi:hypothetical protein ACNO5E_14300 [Vibrio parahaemolyticus]|uniref:hypothetical protein n=1 Tax=Vibrio parahaemolyticus TaxID=670 RepID=UPI0008137E6E|nr:hypothetical protein [Vibrio parahaemolyticus]OCP68462.1 hypothetical protein AKH08_16770 [Vibrio parahaemolyticus]